MVQLHKKIIKASNHVLPVSIKRLLSGSLLFHVLWSPKPFFTLTSIIKFVLPSKAYSFSQRLSLLRQYQTIHNESGLTCHTFDEIIVPSLYVLNNPEKKGVLIEAGCFKGGSTAKFSLLAQLTGRELLVYDSFKGLPAEEIAGITYFGDKYHFKKGQYACNLSSVKKNIARYGDIESCTFIKGWFKDTLPNLKKIVLMVWVDADLPSSNIDAYVHTYKRLVEGGFYFIQDGHIPQVRNIYTGLGMCYLTPRLGVISKG